MKSHRFSIAKAPRPLALALLVGAAIAFAPAARAGEGVNVDVSRHFSFPGASYGAASGQAGSWNDVGLGTSLLVDLSGDLSGVSVTVVAGSDDGWSQFPTTPTQMLLNDNIYSTSGAGWSVSFAGLTAGSYLVFLYAPSVVGVPTGDMTVGGAPVPGFPGDPGGTLIEGTSWAMVQVDVPAGLLTITGSDPGNSGLAGVQLVPAGAVSSYCTAGVSASGCTAHVTASGIPSATASSGFVLSAVKVEGDKSGLYYFGATGRQASPWGNGTSFQCVAPPVKRTGLLQKTGTSGQCNGSFTRDLNVHWTGKPNHNPGAGAVVQAQLWYRDPANTSNQSTSLSDAIEFVVAP